MAAPEEYVLRITFGSQYSHEPHKRVNFAHPDGWFEVVLEEPPRDPMAARHQAIVAAQKILGAEYAFDYGPEGWWTDHAHYYPRGALARLVIHRDGSTTFEVMQTFQARVVSDADWAALASYLALNDNTEGE
jgi:hypothetical protein